jgi:hypothetical protein
MKKVTILAVIVSALWLAAMVWFICLRVEFNQNCTGYLKQAADANTIELAIDRLDKAIEYAESKNWTDGYTSILWKTEDENIGFWYKNLKASRVELEKALCSSQMEQTNVLMKLRETLTDNNESGTYINYPYGLWKYPHNMEFAVFSWIIHIILIIMWILWLIKFISEETCYY